MSDTIEEESLLSQDDIDGLMNFDSDDGQDDGGELSQDDIDGLLGGITDNDDEDDAGELSQDDIDSLLGGGSTSEESQDPEEEEGELSQDDIDRMLGKTANANKEENEDDAESELISMGDIKRVVESSKQEDSSDSGKPEVPVAELEKEVPASDSKAGQVPQAEKDNEDHYLIDDSEAVELEDNLILQEVLDALLEGPLEPIPQESVSESPVEENTEVSKEVEESENLDQRESPIILEDDSDDDLKVVDPEDVTQQDIDSLLNESDNNEEIVSDEEDILISEDDINSLLMAVEQEDDDLLGDEYGNQPHDIDSSQETDMADQPVVLEGMESSEDQSHEEESALAPWYMSKLFLIAASVLLFIGIAVPSAYFLFFSGSSEPEPALMQMADSQTGLEEYGSDVEIDIDKLSGMKTTGQLVLRKFIVPVPGKSPELTYVQADVAIDYTDQRIYDEIQANVAFFRDIVFNAIRRNLSENEKNDVTAASLVWEVETSLKKVLPERFIEKIEFASFSST